MSFDRSSTVIPDSGRKSESGSTGTSMVGAESSAPLQEPAVTAGCSEDISGLTHFRVHADLVRTETKVCRLSNIDAASVTLRPAAGTTGEVQAILFTS